MSTKCQRLMATKVYFSLISVADCPHCLHFRAQSDEAASTWSVADLASRWGKELSKPHSDS